MLPPKPSKITSPYSIPAFYKSSDGTPSLFTPPSVDVRSPQLKGYALSPATITETYSVSVTAVPSSQATSMTMYIVKGYLTVKNSQINFSNRKKFRDFEWLQENLIIHLPGVFVPPLKSPKTLSGVGDDYNFMTANAGMMQTFLSKILNLPHLAYSELFQSWIERHESGIESLKQEFSSLNLQDRFAGFASVAAFLVDDQSFTEFSRTESIDAKMNHLKVFINNRKVIMRKLLQFCYESAESSKNKNKSFFNFLRNFPNLNQEQIEFFNYVPNCEPEYINSKQLNMETYDPSDFVFDDKMSELANTLAKNLWEIESLEMSINAVNKLNGGVSEIANQILELENEIILMNNEKEKRSFFNFRKEKLSEKIETSTHGVEGLRSDAGLMNEWLSLSRFVLLSVEAPTLIHRQIEEINFAFEHFVIGKISNLKQEYDLWQTVGKS